MGGVNVETKVILEGTTIDDAVFVSAILIEIHYDFKRIILEGN